MIYTKFLNIGVFTIKNQRVFEIGKSPIIKQFKNNVTYWLCVFNIEFLKFAGLI